jgi:hypothetical protein
VAICDRFTNKKLFVTDSQGRLEKDRLGNLTKLNYDNVEEGREAELAASAVGAGEGTLPASA